MIKDAIIFLESKTSFDMEGMNTNILIDAITDPYHVYISYLKPLRSWVINVYTTTYLISCIHSIVYILRTITKTMTTK